MHSDGVAPTRTRPLRSPTISATAVRALSGVGQHPPGQRQHRLARRGERRPVPPAAVHQRRAQLVSRALSCRDSVGCATPTRSAARVKLAHIGDGHEVPELLQRHAS